MSKELDQLSKEELIEKIKKQNEQIKQLHSLLAKQKSDSSLAKRSNKETRQFDFKKYDRKHDLLNAKCILLRKGWNYDGFVVQDNTKNTVEDHLFNALIKTRLIESRETSNYSRCGRTDKGVSAFSQVIALDLRSKLSETNEEEVNWCRLLNKVLPKDIRCICSAEVGSELSARFSCKSRTYQYFFQIGTLNLHLMRQAASLFEGTHDFRNFCKLDKTKLITNYNRTIESVNITKFMNYNLSSEIDDDGTTSCTRDIYMLQIKSSAFLYHQIRCIVAVLFCIGEGKEKPELVKQMLDLSYFTKKPQYSLANELPLVLFDCDFEINNWTYDREATRDAITSLNESWIESSIKSTVALSMLKDLEEKKLIETMEDEQFQKYFVKDLRGRNYKHFCDRPQCAMELSEIKKTKLTEKHKHRMESNEDDHKRIKLSLDY